MTGIDDISYTLMKCIDDADEPVWKKRIRERLEEHADRLPVAPVSSQTVGRRINKLHDRALIESQIISPDDIRHDLLIGYTTTDKGVQKLREKRQLLLRQYIQDTYSDEADEEEKPILIELLSDHLALDKDGRRFLEDECDFHELITFVELQLMSKFINDQISDTKLDAFLSLANDSHTEKILNRLTR